MNQPTKRIIIVWFRNDLRLSDHPALAAACSQADAIIPVFICNNHILTGSNASANRNRFLQESLHDLQSSLQRLGSGLVMRSGDSPAELLKLAKQHKASAVYYTADYTPYALQRDKQVKAELRAAGINFKGFGGRLIVNNVAAIRTKAGTVHKVFTPFYNAWLGVQRRDLAALPSRLPALPAGIQLGSTLLGNALSDLQLSPHALFGGESAAQARLATWLKTGVLYYHLRHNDLAADATSRLSADLHFGCLSPREIEHLLPPGPGATAWRRQLAWRDFYNYILFHFPANKTQEFQEQYRGLAWANGSQADDDFERWKLGRTGYPIVDAAMQQLLQEGWMHNRARLIVGSFLTKDLLLDWRRGEQYFMQMLTDGDIANNNGNWQWIASVGVDPAPLFRRLYNPTRQQASYDPKSEYIQRYLPEYTADPDQYTKPIVDHAVARIRTIEAYAKASNSFKSTR